MKLEFCAENCTKLAWAIKRGIHRVELCDNLAVGGTTPSIGVIRQAQAICESNQVELAVMIRPRGGDFCYSQDELSIMRFDIEQAIDQGIKQIVLGCLTPDFRIDLSACNFLLAGLEEIDITFHMAFDRIDPNYKFQSLDQLIELGVKRVLMHGINKDWSVLDNAVEINRYISYLAGRMEVMVGGGITPGNVAYIAQAVETSIFHGTKIVE
ncbi:copper homeostasis protein CutC [Amphibacillus sp. Q70]|uniref:copper homeostasis protein CutC n=1 Tax=Amphibacillus sp. Q70 TaxID=3453416 RepID=UPI003F826566